MATVIVQAITNDFPQYFSDKAKAIAEINQNGGILWERKANASSVYKPWAIGILPIVHLKNYKVHSINAKKPTFNEVTEVLNKCREAHEVSSFFF
jgi:hypothetical protein